MATFNDASITNVRELVDAIDNFLTVSAGFTQDKAPIGAGSGSAAWNAASAVGDTGELWVQVDWDAETHIDLFQSEGWSNLGGGDEDNDTNYPKVIDFFGVTLTSAEIWGFANNATKENERYAHFVVEFNRDGRFVHFGFGHIPPTLKVGSWNGGAYCCGGFWSGGANSYKPTAQGHKLWLDSNHVQVATSSFQPTMTLRDHNDEDNANTRYGVCSNSPTTATSNDQDGNNTQKIIGMSRFGMWPQALLNFPGNPNNAFIGMIPIQVWHRADFNDDENISELCSMADIAVCNISAIQPKEILNIGGTNWRFFPWAQKIVSTTSGVMASKNAGVAYKII